MRKGHSVDGKVRLRLNAKVCVLEKWARDGTTPSDVIVPKGPAALARWRDSALGLESWTSPNIAAPNGPNADLRLRFDEVLRILVPGQSRLPDGKLVSKFDEVLVAQIVTLSEALQVSEAALRRSQHLLLMERERTAALVAQAAKVFPLNGSN